MRKFQDGDRVRFRPSAPSGVAGGFGTIRESTLPPYDWRVNIEGRRGDQWIAVNESEIELVKRNPVVDISEDTIVTYFQSGDGGEHWSLCYEEWIEDALGAGLMVKKYTMYRKYTVEILESRDG